MNNITNIIWHVNYGSIINVNKKLDIKGLTFLKQMEITDIIESNLINFYYLIINNKKELIIEVYISSTKKNINGIWHFKYYKNDKWNVLYDNNKISCTTYQIKFSDYNLLYSLSNIIIDNG